MKQYRPVALLPVLSKVIEKAMVNQLTEQRTNWIREVKDPNQWWTQVYDKISDGRDNDVVSKPKLSIVNERQDFQEKNYGRHKVCCDDDVATDAALEEEEI